VFASSTCLLQENTEVRKYKGLQNEIKINNMKGKGVRVGETF
jgi:hypothetical protein